MPDAFQPSNRLLTDVVANGSGAAFSCPSRAPYRVYQAMIAGTGALTGTVTFEGSCDGATWAPIAAGLDCSGNDAVTKFVAVTAPWPFVRATVSSLTGTGAKVNAWVAF